MAIRYGIRLTLKLKLEHPLLSREIGRILRVWGWILKQKQKVPREEVVVEGNWDGGVGLDWGHFKEVVD